MIITIDGPVAAGKTTAARELAIRLGYTLLDTGAIYRSLALSARNRGIDYEDEAALATTAAGLGLVFRFEGGRNRVLLDGDDVTEAIRHPDVSQAASIVSALPDVRAALLELQRQIARRGKVVAEGRDTGTVVFPDADAKFFVTADDEVRAARRHRELHQKGRDDSLEQVLAELRDRDSRDSSREVAPLVPADDATIIDTTGLDGEAVIRKILGVLAERS
ncbi:MAG: (d)CMP kinase [Acidobacteriota bacterium]|nr:(d)CMP kinase [Acidobacteriota bacterium]